MKISLRRSSCALVHFIYVCFFFLHFSFSSSIHKNHCEKEMFLVSKSTAAAVAAAPNSHICALKIHERNFYRTIRWFSVYFTVDLASCCIAVTTLILISYRFFILFVHYFNTISIDRSNDFDINYFLLVSIDCCSWFRCWLNWSSVSSSLTMLRAAEKKILSCECTTIGICHQIK